MFAYLLKPHNDLASLVLRLGLAAIFVCHGYIKLSLGGGAAWTSAFDETTQLAVAWGELVAGIALFIGFLSRLAAAGLIVIMVGAIYNVTGADFIATGLKKAGIDFTKIGFEYNFAIIVMCAGVIFLGSGFASLDHCLFHRKKTPSTGTGS
jgi:uncharacterized membrane protein YphA (DoxX/SURF4 family)